MNEQQTASEKFSFQKIIKGLTGGRTEVVRHPDLPLRSEYHLTAESDTVYNGQPFRLYLMGTHELVSVSLEECRYKVFLRHEQMLPGIYRPIGADMVCISTEPIFTDEQMSATIRLGIMTSSGGIYAEEFTFNVLPQERKIPTAVFAPAEVSVDAGESISVRIGLIPDDCEGMDIDAEVMGENIVDITSGKGVLNVRGKKAGDSWVKVFPKGFPQVDSSFKVRVREHCFANLGGVFNDDGSPREMWMRIDSKEKFEYSFAIMIEYMLARGNQYIIIDSPYKKNRYMSGDKVPLPEVIAKLAEIRTYRGIFNVRLSITLLEYDKNRFTVWTEQPEFAAPCWWAE